MRWIKLALLMWLCAGFPAWAQEDILVTGRPATAEFLEQVLRRHGLSGHPGDLAPGQSWETTSGQRVINVDWTPPAASVAALSDHPEEVDRLGLLFSGGLTPQRPVRLQYYHLGALEGEAPEVALLVTNPGEEPAWLHMVWAAGKPSLDYFSTGHGNNVAWFGVQQRNEGEILRLEPGETRPVFRDPMPREHVISGTLGLTLMDGPPLQFGLLASPDPSSQPAFDNLLKEGDVHSRGFYPVATQRLRRSHQVGGEETRMAVGALRQETFSGVKELRGDYGVVYEVELELENPSARPATVDLLINPRGGAVTATFLLDGQVVEVPRTEAMAEHVFSSLEIPAGSRQTVRLQTIPEGASSYPIRIVARDRKP